MSDSHGAIGRTFIVLKANDEFGFLDRSKVVNGSNAAPTPVFDHAFWGSSLPSSSIIIPGGGPAPGTSVTVGGYFTDGRVYYDPYSPCGDGLGRWLVVEVGEVTYSTNTTVAALLVAVSKSENPDPTGVNWTKFAIASTGSVAQQAADYPQIGFNTNWIAIQANKFFVGSSGQYSRHLLYLFQRNPVECSASVPANPGVLPSATGLCQVSSGSGSGAAWYCNSPSLLNVCPAETYHTSGQDLDGAHLYLIAPQSGTEASVNLDEITGSVGSPTYVTHGTVSILKQPYPGDGTSWNVGLPNMNQDGGGATLIGAGPGDDRFTGCVVRNYGIWATHTVGLPATGLPTTAVAQFWNIGVDNYLGQVYNFQRIGGTLSGTLYDTPPGSTPTNVIDPSIGVNYYSDLIMGFNLVPLTSQSPPHGYLGAGYAFKSHSGTSFYSPYSTPTYKTGLGPYFPGVACTANRQLCDDRTGDYTHSAVDPTDDYSLWTTSSYAGTPRASGGYGWSTYWAEFFAPEPVQPTFARYTANEGEVETTCPYTGTTCTVNGTAPTGVQAGDWLFASITANLSEQLTLPTGWQLLTLQNGSQPVEVSYPAPCSGEPPAKQHQVFWLAAHRYSGTRDSGSYQFSAPTIVDSYFCNGYYFYYYTELAANIFAYRNASRTLQDPTGQLFYSLWGSATIATSIIVPAASLPDHRKVVNLIAGIVENEPPYEPFGGEIFAQPTGMPALTIETPLDFSNTTVIPEVDADLWTGQGGTFGKYTFSSNQNAPKAAWQLLLTPY